MSEPFISLAAGSDCELDICVDLIVENILAMFDPDCNENEKSCRAVPRRLEYGSRPLASEQVQGKVRVYRCTPCTVDMYTLYSRQR